MNKKIRSIISLLIAVSMCIAMCGYTAFASSAQKMVDECDDFSNIYSKTPQMRIYTDNPDKMKDGDTGRFGRSSSAVGDKSKQSVTYKTDGDIKSVNVTVLYNKLDKMSPTVFYTSSDGENFTVLEMQKDENTGGTGKWDWIVYTAPKIPSGAKFLKIELTGEDSARYWDGGISQVVIEYGSSGGASVTADINESETESEKAIKILSGLGIIDGKDAVSGNITRDEFAKICLRLMGLEKLANSDYGTASSENYSEILINSGIDFPKDGNEITYGGAVKALSFVLGYDKVSASYEAAAAKYGVTNNIPLKNSDMLDMQNAYILIKNAVNADIAVQTGFGKKPQYKVLSDETVLSENLHIYNDTGVVFGVYETALTNDVSGLKRDEVQIDGKVYKCGLKGMFNLLGMSADFYYHDNGSEKTVLYAAPESGVNKILNITADDISSESTKTKIVYSPDGDTKDKTAKISSSADMLYNGRSCGFDISKLHLGDAKITLISNDGDSVYDVVSVKKYDNYFVERVSAPDFTVHGKYKTDTALVLEKSSDEDEIFVVRAGSYTTADKIKPNDILSVESSVGSDGVKRTAVWISNDKVTGTADSIEYKSSSDVIDNIEIDGKTYKLAESYVSAVSKNKADKIEPGDEGVFYLDILGQIAAFEKSESAQGYAYLKSADYDEKYPQNVNFRLFTSSGEWITLHSEKNLYINDKKTECKKIVSAVTLDDGSIGQVVKYKSGENGVLKRIYTAKDYDFAKNPDSAKEQYAVSNGILRKSRYMKSALYNATNMSLYVKANGTNIPCFIDKETVIFDVPEDTADKDDESRYDIRNTAYFSDRNDSYPNIDTYNEDEFSRAPIVVMKNANTKTIKATNEIYIVKKVSDAVNAKGEETLKLTLMSGENEKEFYTADGALITKINSANSSAPAKSDFASLSSGSLKTGDIIQTGCDSKNNVRVVYLWGDVTSLIENPDFVSSFTSGTTPSGRLGIVYGSVSDADVTNKFVKVKSTVEIPYSMRSSHNVYLLLCKNGKPDKLEIRSIDDIAVGDTVIMHLNYMSVKNVVIVRNL